MLFVQTVTTNSALPTGSLSLWHLLVIAIAAALILPLYAGLILWRSRQRMETTHVILWIVVIVVAPYLGSIVWLVFGRQLHGITTPSEPRTRSVPDRHPSAQSTGLRQEPAAAEEL